MLKIDDQFVDVGNGDTKQFCTRVTITDDDANHFEGGEDDESSTFLPSARFINMTTASHFIWIKWLFRIVSEEGIIGEGSIGEGNIGKDNGFVGRIL